MDNETLLQVLGNVAAGKTSVEEAAGKLKHLSFEDIDYAHIDHHRSLRKGFPEVIFGQGKTAEQIIGIMEKMLPQENVALVTRIDQQQAGNVLARFPDAVYHQDARMVVWQKKKLPIQGKGTILVLSAGTSDIPIAKEAYLTAAVMGNPVASVFDVGVAGIHRLFDHKQLIDQASVLIVVAGMEGALPSVVAGMVSRPVIAVPTSIGYGVSLGGLTALFAMLNSCSSNVAVVNIDNGFGAGYMASIINRI
ncbi:MAG: nickel pincer cofactor biosynthesis protein LarB [Desulfobacterales bacterium]|uniref:Nickel pincer cofactor biosynthesis protein LarB n=1 Tax=Candidatus Desulfatibia profunda TaxID=2841695 RepID=A0A8J6TP75_9BACT|nr:nickel pincer cofactor biosynthesis protein LarB [Candidatus Desulfatibia profunda]MBL7178762.1 nickel pincer cofactor biosynthesis protein LarB [Desulfobacterales bacterium]